MDLEQAKKILNQANRFELRDHAFGDMEVTWTNAAGEIATGYFGGGGPSVSVLVTDGEWQHFEGEDARVLSQCGTLAQVSRNDTTGPDQFVEGQVMPGLTKEAVLLEITTPPTDR